MQRAAQLLQKHFGTTDLVSDVCPFDMTDYYEIEMGEDLERQFVSFERLVNPGVLPSVKHITNDLERRISRDCSVYEERRLVNLDPGYLTLSKLVLATTKDFSHRVFVGDGIYAESTLHYHDGRWQAWPWTYPDYADSRYHAFFDQVRRLLKSKLSEPAPLNPDEGAIF